MPRKVRVLTTSFFGGGNSTPERNRERACDLLDAAGAEGADLVCLPETFLHVGAPREGRPYAETVPGPTLDALAVRARRYDTWVVAGLEVRSAGERVDNCALVLNRQGDVAGIYSKVHPTTGECETYGITPGAAPLVVETDFGRVGLAVCFDIGWPQHWAELAAQGAELVVWPSAYNGGFPLQAHAWNHFYYVVSAVQAEHSKIIDITGQVLASTSQHHSLAALTIDLEKEIFHIDEQREKLFRVQQERGAAVGVRGFSEENIFTLESHDPEWPLALLKEHYGLENYRDYHARSTCVQDRHRH